MYEEMFLEIKINQIQLCKLQENEIVKLIKKKTIKIRGT